MMKKTAIDLLDILVSFKSYEIEEKKKCASFIKDKLQALGFDTKIFYDYGSPIVWAEMNNNSNKNILFYLHYDVKPEGDISKWRTEPFKITSDPNDGKIYGRGTGDDKGQLAAVITGIEEAIQQKKLEYNISLLIEGDEESGSPYLEAFCKEQINSKKYDVFMIDSHWALDSPVIYLGNRGQLDIKVQFTDHNMANDCHAGNYGGLLRGAPRKYIMKINDLIDEIENCINEIPSEDELYKNAVSLTYISAGDKARSLIPKNIFFRFDVRYNNEIIIEKLKKILNRVCEESDGTYEVLQEESCFYNKGDQSTLNKLSEIVNTVTNRELKIYNFCGAYLPIKKLNSINGIKYVLPFSNSDELNHCPNENISVQNLNYGIEIIKKILI